MEEVDELIKVERILSIVDEEMRKEIEDEKVLAEEELESFKKRLEAEFERKRSELEKWFRDERKKLEKFYQSKKRAIENRYRSMLKSRLFEIAGERIKELVLGDENIRKAFLKRAIDKLRAFHTTGMRIVCFSEDEGLIREFFDGEVDPSGDPHSVRLVSNDGKLSLVYSLDEFTDEVLKVLGETIKKEAGGLV